MDDDPATATFGWPFCLVLRRFGGESVALAVGVFPPGKKWVESTASNDRLNYVGPIGGCRTNKKPPPRAVDQ